MKKIIYLSIFSFIFLVSCQHQSSEAYGSKVNILKAALENQVKNNQEISFSHKPILEFKDEFYSDGRLVEQVVKIHKQDKICVTNAIFLSESGFGGQEDIIAFKNGKLIYGFQRLIFQEYKPSKNLEDIEFTGNIKYDSKIINDTETIEWLNNSLQRWYKNDFTNTVKESCSERNILPLNLPTIHQSISQFYGTYNFSNYHTDEQLQTGVGIIYNIQLSRNTCHIDMTGYQTDKHFNCYVKPAEGKDSIILYEAENNKSFGTINHHKGGRYTIDMSYYLEGDNHSYDIDKVN